MSTAQQSKSVADRVTDFYRRLTEGMALRDIWTQFRNDAQASYRLYADGVAWEELDKLPPFQRFLRVGGQLFWCMIMHLSPARRVIALVSLFFLVYEEFSPGVGHPTASTWGMLGLVLVLALELADRVTMKRDLEIARDIQRWLVPEDPPVFPGLDVAFSTRPANTVGGDYYDVIRLKDEATGEERLLLVVADVAGKSVPAALLMATLQASLRALAAGGRPLLDLVRSLNRYVCTRSLGGRRFTTAFFAELSPHGNSVGYVNAGHNYPVLLRSGGGFERLETGGLPLGIQEMAEYDSATIKLDVGDVLVVFTDGIVEAVNRQDEEYGDARLLDVLTRASGANAEETLRRLLSELDLFVGSTRQHDDLTCMVARVTARRPSSQPPPPPRQDAGDPVQV